MALLLSATSREAEAQVLMVGSNASGQTTNFTSGTNTFTYAYIGATATDSNNTLNVFNTNTRLTITGGNVQVGFAGNNNSMVISNGGFVSDVTGVISYGNSGVNSNNSVLVTGAGSTWSNSTQVRLGVSGQGSLTVANGGSVVVTGANGIQTAVNVGSVGVLNIGSYGGNDSAGSIVAPQILFQSGSGALNFNQTNTTTLTNAILGTGIVQQLGSGTTILTYSGNTWSAGTVITNGALQIGDGGAKGSIGSGAISNNSVLAFNSASTFTLANSQSITGTGALIQMGTGTTILDAANTTYSGGTLISSGTLQLGVGKNLDTNGSLGTGNVTNNATLAFNRANISETVSNNISGTGELKTVLSSSETLILAGSNSYSGLTTITSNNALQIGTGSTNGTLGSGSVSNAGTLKFNRSDLYTVTNSISGAGALSQIGSGTTLLLNNNCTGTTTVTNGMLQIGNGGTTGSVGSGAITLSGGGILAFNRADSVTLTNSIGGGGGVLSQMGAGTLVITATGATYGVTMISSGTLQIGDGGANGAIGTGAITNNSVLALNSSTNITLGIGNSITGTGALIQMGTGTTIIDAAITTYSGGTLISGGTLQVGTGANLDTNGSLGTGNVTNNATLAFKRYLQTDTVSNSISGTGALTILGSGETLILAGSNRYSGLTIITTNNALQTGTGGTNGTLGSGSVSNAGTLSFNRSDLYTVTNTISGAGALSQIGSGTTILSGSNSYTGVTTITNGTLLANNTTGSAVGTNTVNVSGGGILGGNGTIGGRAYIATNSSLIPGSGGLSGSGALTFTHGLTLQSGATTSFLINATNNFTSINLSGWSLSYGGTLTLNLTTYAPVAVGGNTFTLFNLTNGATETGNFTSLTAIGDTISFTNNAGVWTGTDTYGSTYQFSVATGQLSVASTVPEPSTYALFGLGALALIISYRARSRRVA